MYVFIVNFMLSKRIFVEIWNPIQVTKSGLYFHAKIGHFVGINDPPELPKIESTLGYLALLRKSRPEND